jgi:lipopolysaccharide export system permease protein
VKLYEKYILRETLIVCVAAVALFVGALLAANAMRDVIEWIAMGRLTPLDALKILLLLLPSAISYALPLGTMTGILIVVGRMSSQNEILAMKSVGIGLKEAVRPIFFLAAVFSLLSAYVTAYHAPSSIENYRQSFKKIVREKPMRFIVPRMFTNYFPGYVIHVDGMSDENFSDMRIWQFDESEALDMYMFAKSGKIMFDEGAGVFVLELRDGSAEKFVGIPPDAGQPKPPQIMFFKNISINLPARDIIGTQAGETKKLHHMNLNELLAAKRELNSAKNSMSYGEIRHQKNLINMQIGEHIASAVGISVMALLAVPLGLKVSRSGTTFNVGFALILCFGYYFTMTFFSLLGDNVRIRPDILVWVPNIVLMAIGISLFHRALQH